jgi:signal transduction histidine kinase
LHLVIRMPGAPADNVISRHLRSRKQAIVDVWSQLVLASLPELQKLERSSLVDHLPEFIDLLAKWIDGDTGTARNAFEVLADGHAVQRLGYGIPLDTLTAEYGYLRSTLIRECFSVPTGEGIREPMARLNEGLDQAVHEAVKRYTKQRDQVRDRFIGILAHDLRSPLQTIAIAAGRVVGASSGPDDKLHKAATMIMRSTERMARMIHDVIEFARSHLGSGIPIELHAGNLGEICREVVEEVQAAHPHRDLALELRGNLDGYWDRDRILQAMANIVTNAIHHGSDPVRVVVSESEDRRSIRTLVSNRGRAIPKEELATLFDPFKSRDETRKGLGLGLYIAREVALAHGARCTVESTDAEGTRFTIDWPRTPAEEVPDRG